MRREPFTGSGIPFTNKSDLMNVVVPQYTARVRLLLSAAEELMYGSLGWGDVEIECLMQTLRAEEPTRLTTLVLVGNPFGERGAGAIADALKLGALPAVKELHVPREWPELSCSVCTARKIICRVRSAWLFLEGEPPPANVAACFRIKSKPNSNKGGRSHFHSYGRNLSNIKLIIIVYTFRRQYSCDMSCDQS